jgi:hypothetical protein
LVIDRVRVIKGAQRIDIRPIESIDPLHDIARPHHPPS